MELLRRNMFALKHDVCSQADRVRIAGMTLERSVI